MQEDKYKFMFINSFIQFIPSTIKIPILPGQFTATLNTES